MNRIKMGNVKQWDSLGHINLLLEIEKRFLIKKIEPKITIKPLILVVLRSKP